MEIQADKGIQFLLRIFLEIRLHICKYKSNIQYDRRLSALCMKLQGAEGFCIYQEREGKMIRKILKKITVICMAIMLAVQMVGPMTSEYVMAQSTYSPRTTAPASNNSYYYSSKNVFYANGYGMPNCTAYAYGRAYELLGSKPSLCTGNAGKWYSYNAKNNNYSYGKEPKLGAIACWDNYDSNKGHVAVVEKINSDGTILISESHYGGTVFDTRTIKKDSSNYLTSKRFLGYIYVGEWNTEPSNPYYNSYGFDSPSNNIVITESSFLFQGWIDAKKEISSITCSINHGAYYAETGLYTRPDVPNATAFRIEIDSNILNIGNNDVALCVNFTDGSATVVENRTVTWSPKLLWGFDCPAEGDEISSNQFQFSGWIETARRLQTITCSLNNGEQYFTANLYTRPDVPNATAFRVDIESAYLHYGENYVSVCVTYTDGTAETIAVHKVRKCINDVIEYPRNNEKFTCKDLYFLLQGWSMDDNRTIDHFEFSVNEIESRTIAYSRGDLSEHARYYREQIPLTWLKNGENNISVYAYYTDGTSRNIGNLNVLGDVEHNWDTGTITQSATCTETGIKTYTCTNCLATKSEEIPATGHQNLELRNAKEATSTEEGYSGDTYCKDCGTLIASGHTIDKIESLIQQGSCGTNAKWSLNSNGALCITGTGAMQSFTYKSEMPWYPYLSQIKSVVVERGITSIGDYAFYGMPSMTKIEIPEGVKTIGAFAFKNSAKLQNVELPSTLTKLGESAFYGCTSLQSIKIPEGIYTIWGYTFKNCTSLKEVTLPSTLIKVDEAAFYGCSSLKELEIPSNVSIIGIYCFKNCTSLAKVTVPEKLTEIREAVFYATALPEITIPEGVKKIGPYAFKNCTALKTVTLPETLTSVGEASFYSCTALTKITLPDSVTSIGNYAFRKCENLTDLKLSAKLENVGESAFYGCIGLKTLTIPENVSIIGAYAFKSCTGVTEVSLPDSLKEFGDSAFYGCTAVRKMVIPKNVSKVGAYAFSRCSSLSQVTFSGNAPEIGDSAFSKVTATVSYPADKIGWTQDKLNNYGGTLTWKKL